MSNFIRAVGIGILALGGYGYFAADAGPRADAPALRKVVIEGQASVVKAHTIAKAKKPVVIIPADKAEDDMSRNHKVDYQRKHKKAKAKPVKATKQVVKHKCTCVRSGVLVAYY